MSSENDDKKFGQAEVFLFRESLQAIIFMEGKYCVGLNLNIRATSRNSKLKNSKSQVNVLSHTP